MRGRVAVVNNYMPPAGSTALCGVRSLQSGEDSMRKEFLGLID